MDCKLEDIQAIAAMEIKFGTDEAYWDNLVKFCDGALKNEVYVRSNDEYTFIDTVNGRVVAREGDYVIRANFFDGVRLLPKDILVTNEEHKFINEICHDISRSLDNRND